MKGEYTLAEITAAMEITASMAGRVMAAVHDLDDRVDRCVQLCEGILDIVQPLEVMGDLPTATQHG